MADDDVVSPVAVDVRDLALLRFVEAGNESRRGQDPALLPEDVDPGIRRHGDVGRTVRVEVRRSDAHGAAVRPVGREDDWLVQLAVRPLGVDEQLERHAAAYSVVIRASFLPSPVTSPTAT